MSIIFLLIPLSVVLAAGFLIAFIWAVRSGQYEDTCTPSMRLLMHDGVEIRSGGKSSAASCGAQSEATRSPDPVKAGQPTVLPCSSALSVCVEKQPSAASPMSSLTKPNP